MQDGFNAAPSLKAVDVATATDWVSHAECRVHAVGSCFTLSWRGGDASRNLCPTQRARLCGGGELPISGAWGEVPAPCCSQCWSVTLLRALHSVKCISYLGPGAPTCPWPGSWAAHTGKSEVRQVLDNTEECILHDEQWSIWATCCQEAAGLVFFLRLGIRGNIYILFSKQSLREI